ncbi:MAG: hypothetical protein ACTHQQ_07965 [Solirubrobacteraceae bacterium]
MPTFCRHNRLLHHCPICAREQEIELAPPISSSAPRTELGQGSRRGRPTRAGGTGEHPRPAGGGRKPGGATPVQVRRLERGADDGYRSPLAPGLRSSGEAARLAEELAFAAGRLQALRQRPPGLYAEVAAAGDVEERAWLAFLIAYLCPLDETDPFAAVREVRTRWDAADLPDLSAVRTGPRTAHDPRHPLRTIEAYRGWAQRTGSQAAAFTGDPSWTAERRFTRIFERLALPGLHRDARFDLLVTLGRLGVFELRPGQLMVVGTGEVTVGAKRVFGIGDSLILEGRASAFARACDLPLAALDLGLYNWQRGERAHLGLEPGANPPEAVLETAVAALEL